MPPTGSKKSAPKKTNLLQGKIVSVTFDRLFPTDRYLNSRIGFGYELAPGEQPEKVLSDLNERAQEWWQENFPHMLGKAAEGPDEPTQDQERENILLSIRNAATFETLQSFRRIARSHLDLSSAYNARFEELKKIGEPKKRKPDAAILKQYQKALEEGNEGVIAGITAIYDIKTGDDGN